MNFMPLSKTRLSAKQAACAVVLSCAFSSAVIADPVSEARSDMNAGNYTLAVTKLAPVAERNPTNADARFMLGLAYAGAQNTNAAIDVFRALTRDFPELPEPHNNLAVLLAQQGNYEEARGALEGAISTHKSYATAHENLGDVYTVLATQAYNRVLELDTQNQVVRTKLEMLDRLSRTAGGNTTPPPTTTVAVNTPAAPARPASPPPRVIRPATPATPNAPPPVIRPATTPTAIASPSDQAAARQAVLQAVTLWAEAWSDQDVNAYLNSYSANFTPQDGTSLRAWQDQRRARLAAPKNIKVSVLNPRISLLSDRLALVSFNQRYQSDTYSDEVNKSLRLERTAVGWRIVREESR